MNNSIKKRMQNLLNDSHPSLNKANNKKKVQRYSFTIFMSVLIVGELCLYIANVLSNSLQWLSHGLLISLAILLTGFYWKQYQQIILRDQQLDDLRAELQTLSNTDFLTSVKNQKGMMVIL